MVVAVTGRTRAPGFPTWGEEEEEVVVEAGEEAEAEGTSGPAARNPWRWTWRRTRRARRAEGSRTFVVRKDVGEGWGGVFFGVCPVSHVCPPLPLP